MKKKGTAPKRTKTQIQDNNQQTKIFFLSNIINELETSNMYEKTKFFASGQD
jgi:hypothetical protein